MTLPEPKTVTIRRDRQHAEPDGWSGDWRVGGQVTRSQLTGYPNTVSETLYGKITGQRRVNLWRSVEYTVQVVARQVAELSEQVDLDRDNPRQFDLGRDLDPSDHPDAIRRDSHTRRSCR